LAGRTSSIDHEGFSPVQEKVDQNPQTSVRAYEDAEAEDSRGVAIDEGMANAASVQDLERHDPEGESQACQQNSADPRRKIQHTPGTRYMNAPYPAEEAKWKK
jgi:hypothetical protein